MVITAERLSVDADARFSTANCAKAVDGSSKTYDLDEIIREANTPAEAKLEVSTGECGKVSRVRIRANG
jgi:hypothetical protein